MPTAPQRLTDQAAFPQTRPFGRYWLLRLIARGGMGEVYLAATTGIEGAERPCVVKIIRREHAKDSSFLARFFDEARVQAQLQHPGVVQVIEASTDENGEPFVVAEYVEGRSLGEIRARALQNSYRLSWAEAVAVATAAAEALAHVHERTDARGVPLGIVHRDLSPQNVMVGYGGDVKLIDFGTARGENRRCHTISGVVFAKPGYVAPEVANGHSGDARVDLYALGIILWELAAGRRFLQGDASEHLAAVAKNQRRPEPLARLIGAPARLDDIIQKLTCFELDRRYRTARAAVSDLAALLSQAPSLSNGERGVRARIAQFMATLYPTEPTRSRAEFARLVQVARTMEREGRASVAPVSEPTPAPVDDQILPGTRYRWLRQIGQGAMGTVHEAEHVELARRVAIKVLAPEHATSADYTARFRREARALSRLSHPNLVTIHDFGQATDGRLYCAMELLHGEPLDRVLDREGTLDWRMVLDIAVQAATALRDAHAVGLVHRDLKPSNLFICDDGTLKLLDFGVAKTRDEAADGDTSASFALFGTPEYMAPEQMTAGEVDGRADLYALGCVMYEALSGRRPHRADSTVAMMDAKLAGEAEPLRPRVAVPVEVERVVMRALERDASRRFDDAAQMLAALRKAQGAPEQQRRRRRRLGMAAMVLSMLGALTSLTVAAALRYPAHTQAAIRALVPSSLEAPATPPANVKPAAAVALDTP